MKKLLLPALFSLLAMIPVTGIASEFTYLQYVAPLAPMQWTKSQILNNPQQFLAYLNGRKKYLLYSPDEHTLRARKKELLDELMLYLTWVNNDPLLARKIKQVLIEMRLN